jgi:hypothetical protein
VRILLCCAEEQWQDVVLFDHRFDWHRGEA